VDPLVAVALFDATGTSLPVSGYLFLGLAVGAIAVLFIPETSRRSLENLRDVPEHAGTAAR
jgi:hypothetical protein